MSMGWVCVCMNMLEELSSVKTWFLLSCVWCVHLHVGMSACMQTFKWLCMCTCVVVYVEVLRLTQGMGLSSLFRLSHWDRSLWTQSSLMSGPVSWCTLGIPCLHLWRLASQTDCRVHPVLLWVLRIWTSSFSSLCGKCLILSHPLSPDLDNILLRMFLHCVEAVTCRLGWCGQVLSPMLILGSLQPHWLPQLQSIDFQ